MSVIHLRSLQTIEQIINGSAGLVVVDLFAQWCQPCRQLAPKLEQLAQEYPHVRFCKVDIEEVEGSADKYDVQAMPTIKFYKHGKLIDTVVGANLPRIKTIVKNNA